MNIIKFIIISLLLYSHLLANNLFTYNLQVSNTHPTLKEAVILNLEINQTKSGKVIRFNFKPDKSDDYRLQFLKEEETRDIKDRTHLRIKYAIFPLKAEKLDIPLHIKLQQASKEELKKFVTGSADELMYLQTIDKQFNLSTLHLDVQPLDKKVQLIGNYHFSYNIENNQTLANEQINIRYTLSGTGYPPNIQTILPDIKNVKSFLSKDKYHDKLFHKIVFRYALFSNHDFIIPKITLYSYNPKNKKKQILKTPKIPVTIISKTKKSKHADNFSIISWKRIKHYIDYFLFFIAGFFTYTLYHIFIKSNKKKKSFIEKIKYANKPKELLKILLSYDNKLFNEEILILEQVIYTKKSFSLSKIKKSILEKYIISSKQFEL